MQRIGQGEDRIVKSSEDLGSWAAMHLAAHWARVIPLFAFPEDIRRVIYTINAIESVNMTLRKVTRPHRIFPSDEAVYKVIYLASRGMVLLL